MKFRTRVCLFGVICVTTVVSGVLVTGYRVESVPSYSTTVGKQPAKSEQDPILAGVQTDENPADGKAVLLTIRPSGFVPSELKLPAGLYLLVVRNRTGLDEFAFRVERETGQVLHEVAARRYRRDWKKVLQLTPGTYLVKETNHPEWLCRIVITAN